MCTRLFGRGENSTKSRRGIRSGWRRCRADAGETVEMKDVLCYAEGENVLTGKPLLSNVKVVGEILGQRRAKKVIVFKKKRRKGYSKKTGHRQSFTSLED